MLPEKSLISELEEALVEPNEVYPFFSTAGGGIGMRVCKNEKRLIRHVKAFVTLLKQT
ncbi:hypothetical protein [Halalkalibacter alkalisediminis]|uniref:hypothetical protein n=1 Tax=Halalkalibacter alkalisediminis TaxID=935616 RepID=UPI0023603A41|nr:hypothetical protein [Halalkalibacter alkalisediminis]